MADLDPITAEDLEALRDALALVDRAEFETIEEADIDALAGADAAAAVAAINAAFGLLDLLATRDVQVSTLQAQLDSRRRQPRVQKQASGSQLWGRR